MFLSEQDDLLKNVVGFQNVFYVSVQAKIDGTQKVINE